MLTWIRNLLAAPVFEGDEDKTRIAGLLDVMLLTTLLATVVGTIVMFWIEPNEIVVNALFGVILVVLIFGLRALTRRGHVQLVGTLFSSMLWGGMTFLLFTGEGIRDPSFTAYFLVVAIASLLLGARAATVFGLLSILGMLGIFYAEISGAITVPVQALAGPVHAVTLATTLGLTTLLLRSAVRSISEGFGRARSYAAELEEEREHLEQTVEERTLDLTRRARYLEATAEVARAAASVLDLQELLSQTAALISERFGFYHTAIYLLDPTGEWAALGAASSEGGQRMLAHGHRLRVGQEGIVGYVTDQGRPRIALDVGADAAFFDIPDLPDTRSEMALPLRARGQIIGALDVQSTEPGAFIDEDVAVLQTLADQVALAISNTRLFQQAQESLAAERRAYGEIVREAWQQMVRARPDLGYLCVPHGVYPVESAWRPEMVQASQAGQTVRDGRSTVVIPVNIRDRVVGAVRLRKPDDAGEWTAEEIALMETVTEQLSVALEGARLYQDAQRRAARERLTREITDKMRRATGVEGIVQTAVDELFSALGASRTFVRLGDGPSAPEDGNADQKK
jgi:GAF domain-containing protein